MTAQDNLKRVRRAIQPAGTFFAICLLAGCALLRPLQFQEPSLELEAVELNSLDLSGGSFTLLLDVYNPNSYEIRTTRIETELNLEDTHFGTALLERGTVLPATGRATVAIPFTFSWAGVGAGARALLERGAVSYAMQTRLTLQTAAGRRDLSFRNRGDVPIQDLLPE